VTKSEKQKLKILGLLVVVYIVYRAVF